MDDNNKKNNNKKKKLLLKILGFVVLAAGIGCVITAAVSFFTAISASMNGNFKQPTLFWLFFVGFPLIFASVVILVFSSRIGKTVGNAIHTYTTFSANAASGIPFGPPPPPKICVYCGKANPPYSVTCDSCGANLPHK